MLKKQTVWLLTMLSLMIVLSVYYMSSPNSEELAFLNNADQETSGEGTQMVEGEGEELLEEGDSVISESSTDELFTSIRMQIQDDRSAKKEELEETVASSTASTEEINAAYEEMQQLEEAAKKESIIEETIMAENQYEDVLVRSEDNEVVVTVKAEELSKTEANNIIQMVKDEFGEVTIEVKFQPAS
ncbi:SpoIIIAH-like family protein [Sediminibacillus dalangtanensis]|uniref:SpoIIIAH-like family protein n=1 Tax=Sediminibacillus dalangtanensis TaxID=2729421 RepID=A0ABX7VYQ0_9BACI|nr:SpoIIIAH-like family protein [Sediminibacillus dalangtanensis]QTM99791.1 SpoIIIAH-like family protein [Sediminibacillus dalangtanensis]